MAILWSDVMYYVTFMSTLYNIFILGILCLISLNLRICFYRVTTEDDLCDNDDEDNWSSFNQNNYNGNFVRSTSYIFLETILEETSDDLRTDSERSSEEGNIFLSYK